MQFVSIIELEIIVYLSVKGVAIAADSPGKDPLKSYDVFKSRLL